MKFLNHTLLGLFAGCSLLLAGCQTDFDAPDLVDNKATIVANTTIAEIKSLVAEKSSMEIPYKDEASETPYIISGRVVSSDVSGNIFKTLVIQDETAAISLSINEGNMYTNYRVGQEVLVNLTGLWGGKYHNLICIGAGANEYGSLVTSRMAFSTFKAHSQLNGLPVETVQYVPYGGDVPSDTPYCLVFNDLSKIPIAGEEYINIQSQLVEFNNVTFELGGQANYAAYNENINRTIKDAYGNSIAVRFSGKSSIFNTPLPTGTGTLRGILSYYGTNPNEATNWQLLIRDNSDVIFDGKGTKDTPYTISELLEQNNNGRTAWVAGYIVGSVKGGINTVTSAEDIIFGKDAELSNNVVIAESADCKDIDKCVVVELPAGTELRKYANLLDDPDAYGHLLSVMGTFKKFMGLHGIVECPGTLTDFSIEGIDTGVGNTGSGTETDPYTIDFIRLVQPELVGTWVEGYVVGYVSGRDYATGAKFTSDVTGSDYANNNLIIAPSTDVTDINLAIPVRIADRQNFGMGNNPSIYGKKIKLKGSTGNYLGWFGLSSSETVILIE